MWKVLIAIAAGGIAGLAAWIVGADARRGRGPTGSGSGAGGGGGDAF